MYLKLRHPIVVPPVIANCFAASGRLFVALSRRAASVALIASLCEVTGTRSGRKAVIGISRCRRHKRTHGRPGSDIPEGRSDGVIELSLRETVKICTSRT
ncbi:hypothetical protein NDU88_007600 [Pleurodeles waltl]|uniref:Secreted protein n=1 Tax=Pleurodeles waltl TaxID=8319 RepID=A0AAV7PQP8_PLEWA|nr:hypothetical protein NDU88_007600 [Pleurodeles waltl]